MAQFTLRAQDLPRGLRTVCELSGQFFFTESSQRTAARHTKSKDTDFATERFLMSLDCGRQDRGGEAQHYNTAVRLRVLPFCLCLILYISVSGFPTSPARQCCRT